MIFFRYRRRVPQHHRDLIAASGAPKPNWYVGAAEQASVPRDPELVREVEALKANLSDYRARKQALGEGTERDPSHVSGGMASGSA